MPTQKKSIFDKAIDALTDRDEKAKAAADAKLAAENKAKADAAKAASAKAVMDRAAAAKAAAAKAAADKIAAEKAAAAKMIAAQQEAMKKMAGQGVVPGTSRKGSVTARSLHIRKDHNKDAAEVGGLVKGKEVTILETWTDGKNTWGKIGPDQWVAIVFNGQTYVKLS